MIRKEIDLHLEALAGYINDEDKLVTYKWLSTELNIHVNLSKKVLFEFWDEHRGKKNAVEATFLLIGNLEDGGMRVEVVKEADLASAKNKFNKVISEHVYSLQKTLPDIELLAIADKGDSQHSAVRCTDSIVRSEHELNILRWGTALSSHKPTKAVPNSMTKAQGNENSETKPADRQNGIKEPVVKTTAIKPAEKTQKSAFNNLFAKAVAKQSKEKASAPLSSGGTKNKTPSTSGNAVTSAPKNSWFEAKKKPESKESTNDEPEEMDTSEDIKKPVVASKERSPEVKEVANVETSETIGADSGKSVENKKRVASNSRGKKRQSSSKSDGANKKRKRIVIAVSSDESSDDEMEDIDEPSMPEEPRVPERVIKACPSPPLTKQEGGRRKIRKLVDKTFKDEDGYFVTQKEYVYESCSDQEEEKPVQEKPAEIVEPAAAEPPVKSNNKRKQASLLNFFKKS